MVRFGLFQWKSSKHCIIAWHHMVSSSQQTKNAHLVIGRSRNGNALLTQHAGAVVACACVCAGNQTFASFVNGIKTYSVDSVCEIIECAATSGEAKTLFTICGQIDKRCMHMTNYSAANESFSPWICNDRFSKTRLKNQFLNGRMLRAISPWILPLRRYNRTPTVNASNEDSSIDDWNVNSEACNRIEMRKLHIKMSYPT